MEWIDEELQRIEGRKQNANFERKFFKIPEGLTEIELIIERPRDSPRFAGRKIFRIKHGGEEYDLSVSENSTLYRDLLLAMKKKKTKVKIMRLGSTRNDTRYKVIE